MPKKKKKKTLFSMIYDEDWFFFFSKSFKSMFGQHFYSQLLPASGPKTCAK